MSASPSGTAEEVEDRSLLEHYGPEHAYLHCSAIVWPSAEALRARGTSEFAPGAIIVELGAGTGWFGLGLARSRPDLDIWVTDTAEAGALARLQLNMAAAAGRLPAGVSAPRVAELDWRDFILGAVQNATSGSGEGGSGGGATDSVNATTTSAPLDTCDWIVGSDLVYSEGMAASLCAVLSKVLGRVPPPRCLIAHTCERFGSASFDAALLKELRSNGLRAEPVSGDIETDPAAVTKQRIVVFEIAPAEKLEIEPPARENLGSNAQTPSLVAHKLLDPLACRADALRLADVLAESVLLRSLRAWKLRKPTRSPAHGSLY